MQIGLSVTVKTKKYYTHGNIFCSIEQQINRLMHCNLKDSSESNITNTFLNIILFESFKKKIIPIFSRELHLVLIT